MIGVTPMPPAMNKKSCARGGNPKSFTGAITSNSSPAFTSSIRLDEPPRPLALAFDRDLVTVALGRIVAQ